MNGPIDKKNAITKKIILMILLFVGISFLAGCGQKQTLQTGGNSASIVSQVNNTFKLKLEFDNGNKEEASIVKYAVLLFKTDGDGRLLGESPIDLARYSDNIVLGRNGRSHMSKDISYAAPDYLNGKYALVVDYFDETGSWPYSLSLGNVNLQGKNDDQHSFEIISEKCFLQVAGENATFALTQGVDVKAEENLLITCPVKNHSIQEMSVTPNFENFRRNYLLGESNGQPGASFSAILFKGGETKNISLPIAKAVEPQAYDAALYLTGASKKQVSNTVYAHYIIAGESATIQDIKLDRDNYSAGESANLTLSFHGSADGFGYSRLGGTKNETLEVQIDIQDGSGSSCLSEKASFGLSLDNRTNNEFSMDIGEDCQNPSVTASLIGKDGRTLDRRAFLEEKK